MKSLLFTAFLSCTLLVLKAQNSKKMDTHQQDSLTISRHLKIIISGASMKAMSIPLETYIIPAPYYSGM